MGNSASSLPYSIGKQVSAENSHDGWALHEGNRKSDGMAVTVFCAKKPALAKTPMNPQNPARTQLVPALHHFQYCRRLRHPHILTVHATLDTDHPAESGNNPAALAAANAAAANAAATPTVAPVKAEPGDLIVVTEPCTSLETWLQTANPAPEQIAWGLESIIRALTFLHTQAHLCHGNLSPKSFVVTPAGDVKLWNFSLVTSVSNDQGGVSMHFKEWESVVTPQPYRSPERQEGRWDAIAAAGVHVMDSYGLAVWMDYMYQGQLPQALVKAVQRLSTPNIAMRPRLQPLLKCPVFDTPYQKLQLQLEEFTVQPIEQKVAFWQNLHAQITAGLLPKTQAVYKILPLQKQTIEIFCSTDTMRTQDFYRREVSAILPSMFFIAEHFLEPDQFAPQLTNVIGLLYGINDRGIRGALLQKVPLFAKHLDKNALNTSVFEPMCSGFADSSAGLRELTLKACLVMVPHLTSPNVEKLSRYLVRLQTDPEASIRTNTVIFFAKLAPHLSEMSRHKLLLPALSRAMRDPFMPCRMAALQSCLKMKEFFDPIGVASKVLPAVTPCLLDDAPGVRKEAFTVVDDLLFYLRQESERMNQKQQQQQAAAGGDAGPLQPGTAATAAVVAAQPAPVVPAKAPTSGGYLTGLSSWMTSSAKPNTDPAPAAAAAVAATVTPPPAAAAGRPFVQPPPQPPVPPPRQAAGPSWSTQQQNLNNFNNDDVGGDMDGWGDDLDEGLGDDVGGDMNQNNSDGWGDDDDLDTSDRNNHQVATTSTTTNNKTYMTTPSPSTAAANSLFAPAASDDDDFFGSFDTKKPIRPVVMAVKKPIVGSSTSSLGTKKLAIPIKSKAAGAAAAAAPAAPVVQKLSVEDDGPDGWDDF